jgi:hypothetical protein
MNACMVAAPVSEHGPVEFRTLTALAHPSRLTASKVGHGGFDQDLSGFGANLRAA